MKKPHTRQQAMPEISSYDQREIQEFMGLIAPWGAAYRDATFSFLGVKNGDHVCLAQGHVILPTGKQLPPLLEVVRRPSGLAVFADLRSALIAAALLMHSLEMGYKLCSGFDRANRSR